MEKKAIKKILAILMIIMIISTDFYVLGSNLITYALTLDNSTNNKNIEFSAFFKNEKGEKLEELQTSINAENLKLYAEITVKNDGYLNGALELSNSNFNLKNDILSDSVALIENNKVTLKQINAGETAEVELAIEPIIADTMTADMLLKASDLKLTGKYMETSYKGLNIEATKSIGLDLQADANAAAELETDIITNKVLNVNGNNKRVVQLLVKSRLAENQYPIKQTIINVNVPILIEKLTEGEETVEVQTAPEEVTVLSLGTLATNGERTLSTDNWTNTDGKVQITLSNNNEEITWNKDVYDELVVTFIYPEGVDASILEITTASEITVHNSETKYTAEYKKGIENKEPNGVITLQSSINAQDTNKGQLYANINAAEKQDVPYNTVTTLVVTNPNIVDKVVLHEGPDAFATEGEDLAVNTKYVSTVINKVKMLEILGESGSIEIKNGETTTTINKDSEADDNGNIVVNYENSTNQLDIATSKPANAGILEINHTKAITENAYTRAQLKTVKAIKTNNSVKGTATVDEVETTIVENIVSSSLELKETITKAEFTIKNNKESLATMTANELSLAVELITAGTQYDLYKNPKIEIKLPDAVESLTVTGQPTVLNAEGFKVNASYDNTTKIITITLNGEQTVYPESETTQIYIELNMDVALSKTAPNKMDKIVMTYKNENATQYDGGTTDAGVIEKSIEISSPSGLITMHNSSTYNVIGINGTSEGKQLVQLQKEDAGKEISFDIALINNTEANLKNVRIFGKLPTSGNRISGEDDANTLETTLKNVTAQNATIYYSDNVNATTDLNDEVNSWSTTFNAKAKLFLIVLDALNMETSYSASYKVQLPSPLTQDTTSYAEYDVIYDTETETNLKADAVTIGFATPTELKLETGITAEVGNDVIKNGDTVKAGEVIRYTMSVKNNGTQNITNVQLKSIIPEGTVVVVPEEGYDHSGLSYYDEMADIKEITESVPTLVSGETYTKTYEVRVKSDLTAEKQITNQAIAIYEKTAIESAELTTKIVPSNIRVTMKKLLQSDFAMIAGGTMEYQAHIENFSDKDIKNVEIQIITTNFKLNHISDGRGLHYSMENIPEKIILENVPANGYVCLNMYGETLENATDAIAILVVKDSNGNTYRSNKTANVLEKVDAEISLTSPQDKANVKQGETIEYNIVVENTGNIDSVITIIDNISEYLTVEQIYVNDKIELQTLETAKNDTYIEKISNKLSYGVNVAKGGKATLKIIARVKEVTKDLDATTITNKAEAKIFGMTKATSEEVTHILKVTAEDIKNVISGRVWFDGNRNGAKDAGENILKGINVKLYDVNINNFAKNSEGVTFETTTNDKGEYTFTKVPNGKYIVLFEYDTNEYEPTLYQKEGIDSSINSKVVSKEVTINGESKTYAVTDIINLEDNISNINMGLKERLIFDLQLSKYISRIVIQNSNGTKAYDYENATLGKVEIHRKQIKGTVVVLEYTIKVKNNGEVAGYANNIVDYLTSGLTFNSELNPDWYLAGEDLYTKKLAGQIINPGEEKEVKLILTKKMTDENTGVVNNRAEICDAYNEYGEADINSTPNNNMAGENDLGAADVIISIATGGSIIAYIILVMINTVLIFIAIKLMIKNNIIKIKRERR